MGTEKETKPTEIESKEEHKKKAIELLEETTWEIPWVRPIFTFFVKEGKAVKNGWVAFLIMAGICIYATHEWYKKRLEDVERERDKYFQAYLTLQASAHLQDPTLVELKIEIRTFLEGVNPNIPQMIDLGAKEIKVLLSTVNQVKLDALSQKKGFQTYLSYKQTDVSIGGHNVTTIVGSQDGIQGGFMNDRNSAGGEFRGFILYPSDALKR